MTDGGLGRGERAAGLTRAALRNRPIRRVVAGFAALTMGEWVLGTTVAIHAYAVDGAFAVGLVGFRFVPAAAAGLWTTRLAEHPARERILAATAAARMLATGGVAVALALNGPLALVIALVWLDAAVGSAYRPAQAALLPSLARTPGELAAAAGLASNVKSSGQILGALLGSLLVSTLPIALAVAGAALLHAIATVTALAAVLSLPPVDVIAARRMRTGFASLRTARRCSATTARPASSCSTPACDPWCAACGSRSRSSPPHASCHWVAPASACCSQPPASAPSSPSSRQRSWSATAGSRAGSPAACCSAGCRSRRPARSAVPRRRSSSW
jgi:hypothetical protein